MRKWYSLIDKIHRKENLELAFKKVKRNKGAPGIDGETVSDFDKELEMNIEFLHEKLKTNTYEPSPVRRVEIEKPDGGGVRLLGVPTVKDRVVQQAIVNIIEPIYDVTFHPSSYGYRPNRSQHQAVAKAERFMNKYGLTEVVDMDLSKCFDMLDHDIILETVAERISDGKVLELIRKFLKSGAMHSNNFISTEIGSCQGGVISPLLSNIYLNRFDQKMMSKGIRVVRYADDTLIFAKDKQTAGNYLAFATKVLEEELKLTVLRGWMNYYRVANIKALIRELMSWIRRRLRMIKMKQWKTYKAMHKAMRKQGIKGTGEKMAVTKWKNSKVHIIHMLLPNEFFENLGLVDISKYEVGLLSNYY